MFMLLAPITAAHIETCTLVQIAAFCMEKKYKQKSLRRDYSPLRSRGENNEILRILINTVK